ncbi:MAG: helix-turn-helix domain-containing protein [Acidobacteriaceae bacterium]|nr:helix-turn-helix domain-containing protein [Acidobacteriaceae bacterium]
MPPEAQVLTVREVAEYLRVHPSTLYWLLKTASARLQNRQ